MRVRSPSVDCTHAAQTDSATHYNEPRLDCSGLVRVITESASLCVLSVLQLLPDRSDVYVGHTTWTEYFSMYRFVQA